MEKDVVDLGKEIERLERQAAIDAELNKPSSTPITNKPNGAPDGEEKNFFRSIATAINTSSGDRKIPVVASKGEASWIDEEGRSRNRMTLLGRWQSALIRRQLC